MGSGVRRDPQSDRKARGMERVMCTNAVSWKRGKPRWSLRLTEKPLEIRAGTRKD